MEFRKKYFIAMPLSILFLYIGLYSTIYINEYSVSAYLGNLFPLLLATAFWIIEKLKYDEVNRNDTTSKSFKRELPRGETSFAFLIVFILYFFIPPIAYNIDAKIGGNEILVYIVILFALVPLCIYVLRELFKIDIKVAKENIYKYISLLLLFSIILIGVNVCISIIYEIFDLQLVGANEDSINDTINTAPVIAKILFILYVLIGAPILEELVFRGVVINHNDTRIVNIIGAVLISLLFAFLHYSASYDADLKTFTDPFSVFIPYFMMSLVFCASYIKSDFNLLIPIGVHMLNNIQALVF